MSVLLKGLAQLTRSITAIVTMFDSGGSSGQLRREFGYPPFGDIRQCLLALASSDEIVVNLTAALQFRFGKTSTLRGHNVGNLLLTALTDVCGSTEKAVAEVSSLLRITGQVLPVTFDNAHLQAELANGDMLYEEADIDSRDTPIPNIKRILLSQPVNTNPRVLEAITKADAIVLGPGDLYTSILPNLLPQGMSHAVSEAKAKLIFVCNLMTKRGETDNYSASHFIRAVSEHINGRRIDQILVNNAPINTEVITEYAKYGAKPVLLDKDKLDPYVNSTIPGIFIASSNKNLLPLRHDPQALGEAIISIATSEK